MPPKFRMGWNITAKTQVSRGSRCPAPAARQPGRRWCSARRRVVAVSCAGSLSRGGSCPQPRRARGGGPRGRRRALLDGYRPARRREPGPRGRSRAPRRRRPVAVRASGPSGTSAGSGCAPRPPVRRPVRPAGERGRRAAVRGVGLRLRVHGLALLRRERPARGVGRAAARGPARARPASRSASARRDAESLVVRRRGSRWGSRAGRGCRPTPPSRRSAAAARPLPFPAGVRRVRPQRRPRDHGGRGRRAPPARVRDAAGRVEHRARRGSGAAGSGRRATTRCVRRRLGGGAVPPDRRRPGCRTATCCVVERRFPPIGARIVRLARASLEGTRAARAASRSPRFERPLTLDNFEGVEARRDASGRTLVYLLSDDNDCAKTAGSRRLGPAAHAAAALRPRGLSALSRRAPSRPSPARPRRSRPRRFIFSCRVVGRTPSARAARRWLPLAARRASSITCRS